MVAETLSPFDAIPTTDIGAPARKPRELSQSPAAIKARAQRARAKGNEPRRKVGRPRKTPGRAPKSLAPEIGAFLALVNGIVIASPLGTRPVEAILDPAVMPTRVGDELDAVEINALASALDAQCRRSPRFRRYVEMALGAGSGGTLITVLGLIVARRAARHGILPENVDMMAGMVLSADIESIAAMTPDKPTTDPDTGENVPDRSATDGDE